MSRRFHAFLLVGIVVILNVISAVILKETADKNSISFLVLCALIIFVVFINLLRVVFWAMVHKHFRLSDSYPLTSLFFPLILVVSVIYGEAISVTRLVGTGFIMLGVLMLIKEDKVMQGSEKYI